MAYRAIADNEIDAYSPVTGRLMKAYRDNALGVAVRLFSPPARFSYTTSAGVTYTDSGTFSIYIPSTCVGPEGTRLYLPTYLSVTVAAGDEATISARWKVGSAYSDTTYTTVTAGATLGASSSVVKYLTLDYSGTANTVQAFTIQGYVEGAFTTASLAFDNTVIRGYVAPLPYPGGY